MYRRSNLLYTELRRHVLSGLLPVDA